MIKCYLIKKNQMRDLFIHLYIYIYIHIHYLWATRRLEMRKLEVGVVVEMTMRVDVGGAWGVLWWWVRGSRGCALYIYIYSF